MLELELGKSRVQIDDIFDYGSDDSYTFKDNIDYKDPNILASMIAGTFFKCGKAGFFEQAITNNGAERPTEEEEKLVEDLLHKQLLKFFNEYGSSEINSLVSQNLEKYTNSWTVESIFLDLCYGLTGELGTLFGSFASPDEVFPNKKPFSNKFQLEEEKKQFKGSFANSFLKIFQDEEIVTECIKNTWFGRLALVENYKKTGSISPEDKSVLSEIIWEEDKKTNKKIPNYGKTNLKFFARDGKEEFDSKLGSFVLRLKNEDNLQLLETIIAADNTKGEPVENIISKPVSELPNPPGPDNTKAEPVGGEDTSKTELGLINPELTAGTLAPDNRKWVYLITALGATVVACALAKYGVEALPNYLRYKGSTSITIFINVALAAEVSYGVGCLVEFSLGKIMDSNPEPASNHTPKL